MKVQALDVRLSKRARYARWAHNDVQVESGCYAIANVLDDILYIGQSENLQRRFSQHLDDSRMNGDRSIGLAHWFYWFSTPTDQLLATEARLLSQFKFHTGKLPPLNRVGP